MKNNHPKQSVGNILTFKKNTPISKASINNITRFLIQILYATLIFTSSQAASNVIDDVKADMLLNEAELLKAPAGAGWSRQANIDMGAAARGDATPFWWKPNDQYYKSSNNWDAITAWFVIYPGEMHNATNVRVMLSGIKLFILEHSTNSWRMINVNQTEPTWDSIQQVDLKAAAHKSKLNKRIEPNGKISYKLSAGLNPIHGGITKYEINGSDVKAVYAQVTTKLILDNPNEQDDRANAQILISVGADYYPTTTHKIADFAKPYTWVPAIAGSRFGLARKLPRVHHMATINPPGSIKNSSVYPDQNKTISIAEFEANPPPVLIPDSTTTRFSTQQKCDH